MVSLLESKGPLGQLGASIQQLAEMVEGEMSTCRVPLLPNTALDELKPVTRRAVEATGLLEAVLGVEGPSHLTSFSRSVPVVCPFPLPLSGLGFES